MFHNYTLYCKARGVKLPGLAADVRLQARLESWQEQARELEEIEARKSLTMISQEVMAMLATDIITGKAAEHVCAVKGGASRFERAFFVR